MKPCNWVARTVVAVAAVMATTAAAAHANTPPASPSFGAKGCAVDPVAATTSATAPKLRLASAPRGTRPAAQVTRNDRADLTFELRPSPDGGAQVIGQGGGLQITKTVQSTGEFVLVLSTDRDKVTISVNGQGTTVTRGKNSAALTRAAASQEQADKIRRLLADSAAVVQFRRAAAALIDADDRTPASLAMIMSDAIVGLLTGDVGAPRRIAQFLAHHANANVRPVAMLEDCFYVMEQRMLVAWNDYYECYASVFPAWFYDDLCALRWVVQVESYWFGFLSCSGLNW